MTVSTTSPRCNLLKSARNARIVKKASAAARRTKSAFAGIQFLISTTVGRVGGVQSFVSEPDVPERIKTGTSAARCSAIADMMAAVVLRSGG